MSRSFTSFENKHGPDGRDLCSALQAKSARSGHDTKRINQIKDKIAEAKRLAALVVQPDDPNDAG